MENRNISSTNEKASEGKAMEGYLENNFLSNMSPEIRTPINGIIRIVQLLKQTALTHEQWEMVNLLEISSNSLLTVIDEALTLSKMDSER